MDAAGRASVPGIVRWCPEEAAFPFSRWPENRAVLRRIERFDAMIAAGWLEAELLRAGRLCRHCRPARRGLPVVAHWRDLSFEAARAEGLAAPAAARRQLTWLGAGTARAPALGADSLCRRSPAWQRPSTALEFPWGGHDLMWLQALPPPLALAVVLALRRVPRCQRASLQDPFLNALRKERIPSPSTW